VSFAATTLCVASQSALIVVSVYFVIDSVRKLLDTPSYSVGSDDGRVAQKVSQILAQPFVFYGREIR
jgi:hypothetical protein